MEKKKLLFITAADMGLRFVTDVPTIAGGGQYKVQKKIRETFEPDWEVEFKADSRSDHAKCSADVTLVTDHLKLYLEEGKYSNVVSVPAKLFIEGDYQAIKRAVDRMFVKAYLHSA